MNIEPGTPVLLKGGDREPDVPARVLSIAADGAVSISTEAARYRFTAEGWHSMLLHGIATIDSTGINPIH